MSESTCPGPGCIDGPAIDGLCLEHYIEPLLPLAAAFKPRTKAPAIVRFLHYTDLSGGSRQSRPAFRLGKRNTRPAKGQMPLWS